MLRCSEIVCWRYEALMMVMMHMIDRNKIERSAPFVLDRAFSVPNDALRDIILFDEAICTVVEDRTNG